MKKTNILFLSDQYNIMSELDLDSHKEVIFRLLKWETGYVTIPIAHEQDVSAFYVMTHIVDSNNVCILDQERWKINLLLADSFDFHDLDNDHPNKILWQRAYSIKTVKLPQVTKQPRIFKKDVFNDYLFRSFKEDNPFNIDKIINYYMSPPHFTYNTIAMNHFHPAQNEYAMITPDKLWKRFTECNRDYLPFVQCPDGIIRCTPNTEYYKQFPQRIPKY